MYTQFYGFSEKPFNITPDPRFLYQTADHREALASMIYGIREKKGFIAITGEIGTGKTTLIYALLKELRGGVKTVLLFHTHITFVQLLMNILSELEIPTPDEKETALIQRLNEYLIQGLSRNENLTVILDEAQNLSREVMEGIRMLSNLETTTSKLLQIILVGQPELDVKLTEPGLRQLRQRIEIKRQIRPLSREECQEYIEHRLKLVGSSSSKIFTPEAISLICDYGKGIPRMINIVCDNALLIGYGLFQKRIDSNILQEVIRDIEGFPPANLNSPEPLRNPSPPSLLPSDLSSSLPTSLLTEFIHSLKGTLDSIKTTSELLIDQLGEDGSRKSHFSEFQKDIRNMDWGLDGLLRYVHLSTPVKKTDTVHTLLEEILKDFERPLAEKRIKIYKKFEKDLSEVAIPDESLRYILTSVLQYVHSRLSPKGSLGVMTKSLRIQKGLDRGYHPCGENGRSIEIFFVFTDGKSPWEPIEYQSVPSSIQKEDVFQLTFRLVKELVQKNRGMVELRESKNSPRSIIALIFPAEKRKVVTYPPIGI